MVADAVVRRQHGVVSRQQLLDAGVTPGQVRARVRRGELHRLHRAVYAVADPALLPLATLSAALLAIGPHAVLSHRSAAALWGLGSPDPSVVHVSLSTRHLRAHPGIATHRVKPLDRADLTTRSHLRVTAPARTVIDFATDASTAELERALNEARALKLFTDRQLEAALARAPRTHPGAAKLRALLRRHIGRVMTRSERERKLLKLLESAGLPKPLVNQPLHGYVPDFYWPEFRLILEFDGFRTHGGRRKFESDRRRDQTFATVGIQTLRATWLQLEYEPVALVVRIGQAMVARAA